MKRLIIVILTSIALTGCANSWMWNIPAPGEGIPGPCDTSYVQEHGSYDCDIATLEYQHSMINLNRAIRRGGIY